MWRVVVRVYCPNRLGARRGEGRSEALLHCERERPGENSQGSLRPPREVGHAQSSQRSGGFFKRLERAVHLSRRENTTHERQGRRFALYAGWHSLAGEHERQTDGCDRGRTEEVAGKTGSTSVLPGVP